MNVYKKTLLTFVGVGLLGACSSERDMSGVVTKVCAPSFYIDTNGDTYADHAVRFETHTTELRHIYDYVCVGDTLKFHTNTPSKRVDIIGKLDSVNNRSYNDLIEIYNKNLRRRIPVEPKLR